MASTRHLSQIAGQTAPAATNIQHALAGLDQQLGSDMALFGQLRRFQVFIALFKISAGILAFAVQKKLVQPIIQIVVVRHIGA